MAVKLIAKQKSAPKKKSVGEEALAAGIAGVVDHMGELKVLIDNAKKWQKEYDQHRNDLKKEIPKGFPVDQPYVFEGFKYNAVFSKQSEVRTVTDLKKLHKVLGDTFYSVVTVSLTNLDKYLAEIEQEGIVTKEQTGARLCSIKER